ncbi:hypothetical protein KSP39_PZI020911 [Platanthera zijinensis]|uniref:Uncharacterized protein n=1 Tax=Platanthera zijinensis TaxID=2320716 RepID=A0AAP0AZQ9_9ASPA
MGHPEVPLSIISKAAEVQFLVVVDKVLLGNKWLRKATGIPPKLPYPVDSFEEMYEVGSGCRRPKSGEKSRPQEDSDDSVSYCWLSEESTPPAGFSTGSDQVEFLDIQLSILALGKLMIHTGA